MQKFLLILLMLIATVDCTSKGLKAHAADANISLGIAYLQQGNFENAFIALNQATHISPNSPSSWSAKGYFEEVTGNISEAAEDYKHAIRLGPHEGSEHNNFGAFLCRNGQYRLAITEFLNAAQLSDYAYKATALENAGLCALKIPDSHLAERYFLAALQRNPHCTLALLELAKIRDKEGNLLDAQKYLTEFQTLQ